MAAGNTTPAVVLARGREKPLRNRHPWVFSGAIERVVGDPAPGSIVTVNDTEGRFLARGYWNPKSQIQVRALTWQDEPIDDSWWARALLRAYRVREALRAGGTTNAYRLAHAESDYLPGLIVDVYGEYAVMQALTLGIDQRKATIARLLMDITGVRGVYERSDVDVRRKEGLREHVGVITGDAPPQTIEIAEHGARLLVNIAHGHKTGFYLDQRENRRLVREYVARLLNDAQAANKPPRVLNLFSYTGGFGIQAAAGGAGYVVNTDASHDVLELAEQATALNAAVSTETEYLQADVFDLLRDYVAGGERFDLIVCDPPKFAHNAGQVEKAARGYKDLNLNSFRLLNPGGYLFTFSCSGAIDADLFQKIVFGALADSGRDGQIVRYLSADEDHPVALTFPEGAYLKGLLVRVY